MGFHFVYLYSQKAPFTLKPQNPGLKTYPKRYAKSKKKHKTFVKMKVKT